MADGDRIAQSGAAGFARRGYHTLAERLREQILDGTLPDGALLPNERELGGQSGLSRGSVREALRMLEVEGFVSTRPGRNGGSTVRRPGPAGVSRSLQAFVRGQGVAFATVLEAREALEPALAGLAALHRGAHDLRALAAASAAMAACDDNAAFIAANSRWHWAVVEASGNDVLIAVVGAIGDLLHQSNVERFVSPEVRAAVVRAHAGIEAAISDHDKDAAERRMARHLRSYREQVRPVAPDRIGLS